MTAGTPVRTKSREYRALQARLEDVVARLELTEMQLRQLETTIHALARETGVSIGGPCDRCNRSRLLIKDHQLSCPTCGYRRSL